MLLRSGRVEQEVKATLLELGWRERNGGYELPDVAVIKRPYYDVPGDYSIEARLLAPWPGGMFAPITWVHLHASDCRVRQKVRDLHDQIQSYESQRVFVERFWGLLLAAGFRHYGGDEFLYVPDQKNFKTFVSFTNYNEVRMNVEDALGNDLCEVILTFEGLSDARKLVKMANLWGANLSLDT